MATTHLIRGCAVLLALSGCASTTMPPENNQRELLASFTLSPTHTIEFLEHEPGETVIIERLNVDKDEQLINYDTGRTLSSAFMALRPGEALPASLRRADKRSASKKYARLSEPLSSSHGNLAAEEAGSITPPQTMPTDPVPFGGWKDWQSDAQWFLSNFCNRGQYKWCPINVNGWAYSGAKYDTTWFQSTGFAQGFNSTARFRVQYRKCSGALWWYGCKWTVPSNGTYTLQPRTLLTYTWTTRGSRWAGIDNSADRVGLAVLWNTAGKPGVPTKNPGPCNDSGEFCCNSIYQWGGITFYCNGNVTCSSGICVPK